MPELPSPGLPAAAVLLRRYRAVPLALVVGAALSVWMFTITRDAEQRAAQTAVATMASQRLDLLRENLGNSLAALHALEGLAHTGLPVDREHFSRFTAGALARQPELQSLSWSPRVPAAERATVEAAIRSEGFPDFEFIDRDTTTGEIRPAPVQPDFYYPELFIEPFARNRQQFGNTNSRPSGNALRARDSGSISTTSLIRPLRNERRDPGFIVQLPLYDTVVVPDTLEGRREHFSGLVTAVFRIAELVGPALARLPGLRVEVFDPHPVANSVTYSLPAADDAPPARSLVPCTLTLPVANRELAITFTPTTTWHASHPHLQSWGVLAGGLLLTALTATYLLTAHRRNEQIARANAALQVEVAVRKHAEEAAAMANRAKSDFVSSLSHEIRTPLNSILGYAQILERATSLPAEHRDAVAAVSGSGRHLLGLLDSILDLSRIEAGRVDSQRVAFDLNALLDGLAAMFKPRCAGKPLELRIDRRIPAGRGAVLGDEGKVRQVLINLISNAVKFTPAGTIVIGLRPGAGPDQWYFEVSDTGIGIAPAERANLFMRFHQTAAGRRLGGSGLGLAIARGHVELMGGRLEMASERGSGTRFFFTLPLAAAVLARASGPADPLPRLAAGVRVRALVVDDDRDNRHILAQWLRDLGCAIAEAGTARDARDLALAAPPDVLFLDVFLADTTGPDLLTTLRADGLPASTPVLLHTAALLTREQRESLQATGADLLQKPFRIEDLCACLRRVPGVRFENSTTPKTATTIAAPPNLATLLVPEDLRERLTVAAEMHSTTVLKSCLQELRQLGGPAEALAEHLRLLLRAYDLAAIVTLLRGLRPIAAAGVELTSSTEAAP